MEVIIQGAVSALGFVEDGVYSPEPDCYETLRDLIRYLRNDDDVWIARRTIGERNVVENDLIPLMKTMHHDDKMFDIVLRLMVNIVQPSIISTMGKIPDDQRHLKYVYELENNLRKAKLAFADAELFELLKHRLEAYFLNTEWEERTEEDRLVMERIIVLLRYVLSISSSRGDEKRTGLESNSHDRVITAFLQSGIHQSLIHIASQSQERDFHLSMLEIFALVVKEHNPEDIASATGERSQEEKERAEEELKQAFEAERNRIADLKRKVTGSRHSRFAGSYWVEGMQTMNKENKFFTNKAVKDATKVSFHDERKKRKRATATSKTFDVKQETHLSSLELRVEMKKFVEAVLERAFNRLMKSTKELAFGPRRSIAQRNADMHYFLLARFFMKFCRLTKMSPSLVAPCVGIEAFHHVQTQIVKYLEDAAVQKSEGKMFGMKAQYAVIAYKELILLHQHMNDNGSVEDKEAARAACKHIMDVEEYRDLGISILKKFQPTFLSRTFLRELVLATHYYFRMLERSVKKGELTSVLAKKKKRITRKPKKHADTDAKPTKPQCDFFAFERLDLIWARICEELSDVVMGHAEASENQLPMSNMLDCSDEEHQKFAMIRIQRALRERRVADAVGLYRAARDIWLIEEVFGKSDMPAEEEFVELREIFYADLSEVGDSLLLAEMNSDARFRNREMLDEDFGSGDEEGEFSYETKEVSFDFNGYIGRFASADIVKWYVFLLTDFERNSVELNKALVKMLHRIAFDLKMQCRLYQLSLFRVFQRVGQRMQTIAKEERKTHSLYELYTFGFHILKKFFVRMTEVGEKMAPEALFWKGAKESYELEFGFGSYTQSTEEAKLTWTEDLEGQLRSLYGEWKEMDERPSDMDVLDFIEANLDRPRTRHQIARKMKEFGLDPLGAKASRGSASDRQFPLVAMKELVERFHEMDDNSNYDLVDWLRTSFEERGTGTFTRPKIIKQLTYAGINYAKQKPKKTPKVPKWPEELVEELSNLKMQFEEDEDKGENVRLADYCIHRLSKTKPRRQVEIQLVALGADVPISEVVRRPRDTEKSGGGSRKKSKKNGSDSENEEEEREESDDEEEEEEKSEAGTSDEEDDEVGALVDSDDENGDMGARLPRAKKSKLPIDDGRNGTATMASKPVNDVDSEEKMDTTEFDRKKRRIVMDSDEEELEDLRKEKRPEAVSSKFRSESPEAATDPRPSSASQIRKTEKRSRKIVMDSDDEPEDSEKMPVAVESKNRSASPEESGDSRPNSTTQSQTVGKKRRRLASSDESDEDEPAAVSTLSQSSADGAQSARKARRVVIDSDGED